MHERNDIFEKIIKLVEIKINKFAYACDMIGNYIFGMGTGIFYAGTVKYISYFRKKKYLVILLILNGRYIDYNYLKYIEKIVFLG